MNRTGVSWVVNPDGTPGFAWNPLVGCSHVSAGCAHCWAERLAATRLAHLPEYAGLSCAVEPCEVGAKPSYLWSGEVRFLPERLAEPLRRRTPSSIAVCLMGDLYHPKVANEQIAAVYGVMAACPQHRFYVCTKRAKRRREWFEWIVKQAARKERYASLPSHWQVPHEIAYWAEALGMTRPVTKEPIAQAKSWPLPNVVQLTSVEDQHTADERIPDALATPASVRGLSVEPLLEGIDIQVWLGPQGGVAGHCVSIDGEWWHQPGECEGAAVNCSGRCCQRGMDWVVVGCESGPKARPMDHEWAAALWRQCLAARVPFFFKQEMVGGKLCHEPTLEGRTWRELPRLDAG